MNREQVTAEEIALQAGLSARESEVLFLNVCDGLPYPEIARRLRVEVSTVHSLISKGRTKILAEIRRQSRLDPVARGDAGTLHACSRSCPKSARN